MGQYYTAVNLDKNEYLYSHDLDTGLKLMESAYINDSHRTNLYMNTLTKLMQNQWAKDRVIMIGDYADFRWASDKTSLQKDKEFYLNLTKEKEFNYLKEKNARGYYNTLFADDANFENVSHSYKVDDEEIPRFLCNKQTKEFVDLYELPVEYKYKDTNTNEVSFVSIYPLPLLIAVGNGQGGGDYFGLNEEKVGLWCDSSNHIYFTDEKPSNYTELPFVFTENDKIEYKEDYI